MKINTYMEDLLTVQDVSKKLNVCDATVYNYIRKNKINSIKPGRRHLFTQKDVDDYINGEIKAHRHPLVIRVGSY